MTSAVDPALARSLLEAAAEHYFAGLKSSGVALQQIKWKGAVGAELVDHFRLGFCDGTLKDALTTRSKDDSATKHALVQLGLVRTNGAERFVGSLVVPVFDDTGHVVQLRGGEYHVLTGRSTNERSIPFGVDAVFHRSGFSVSEELIVASSTIDALRFWFAGHVNVTAADKVDAAMLATMKKAKTRRVLLAFNAGNVGETAALTAAKRLADVGIDAFRVPLRRRFMPTSRQWGQLIRAAAPMLGAPPRPEPPPIGLEWSRTKGVQR